MAAPVTLRDAPDAAVATRSRLGTHELNAYFGAVHAIKQATLTFPDRSVTAIIGPSGSGKSTFLRCLNRMHETVPLTRVNGEVLLDGRNLYGRGVNPIEVRRHIGMVFQRPTPFPTMSIRDNVAAGLRAFSRDRPSRRKEVEIVEASLRTAGLWDEVRDRLKDSATALSGGQQQRLCIARAMATEPSVILLDEPTASLDIKTKDVVIDLILELKKNGTSVLCISHDEYTLDRLTDRNVHLQYGEIVEQELSKNLSTNDLAIR